MKKLFTLCAAAIMGSVMAFAQSDYTPTENVFQFVDEDGAVVADGTTWEVYEKHDSLINLPGLDPIDQGTMVLSGLSVKNTAEGDVYCAVDYQVTQIDGGTFQICFPSQCQGVSSVTDVLSTDAGIVSAGSTKDMLTEWVKAGQWQYRGYRRMQGHGAAQDHAPGADRRGGRLPHLWL